MTSLVLSLKSVILSYRSRDLKRFVEGDRVRQWEPFRRQAERRVRLLEGAAALADLAELPSNNLEALRGDRNGQFSIRVNSRWRLCFRWPVGDQGPSDVELVDYH